MLQSIISAKVEKSKQNIETYLNNNSSTQTQNQNKEVASIQQSNARTIQQASFHPQGNGTAPNKNKPVKNEVEVKIMNITGKQFSKEGMMFRFNKEQGKFQFLFEEEGLKTKLQGKREALLGKRIKTNPTDGSCTFEAKSAIIKKEDTKQSSLKGQTVWTNGKQVQEVTIVIWLKQKEQLKSLMETSFMDGLFDPASASNFVDVIKTIDIQPIDEGAEAEEDQGLIKLLMPTPSQQGEVDKIRKTIKQMKEEDKTTVLFEVFKIKKQYDDPNSIKKLKCPVHYCVYCQKKSYKDIQQLKNHLKIKHPELSKHGIQLSEYDGTFQYGSKAIDLALFIGKMYPLQMKKIIKQMKTKVVQ